MQVKRSTGVCHSIQDKKKTVDMTFCVCKQYFLKARWIGWWGGGRGEALHIFMLFLGLS